MPHAMINDLAQRLLTLNKFEQRSQLRCFLDSLNLPENCHVLDFGCGTGLFAAMFQKRGMNYTGYDIDEQLIEYAKHLYPLSFFTTQKTQMMKFGPYDLILINCCTHHIPDDVLDIELEILRSSLRPAGICVLVDILKMESETEPKVHKWFMKLEQGRHLRTRDEYLDKMSSHFCIKTETAWRSHLFSCSHRLNPLYNDLIVIAGGFKL